MPTVKQADTTPEPKTTSGATPTKGLTIRPLPPEIVRQMPKVERTVAERGFLEIVTDKN